MTDFPSNSLRELLAQAEELNARVREAWSNADDLVEELDRISNQFCLPLIEKIELAIELDKSLCKKKTTKGVSDQDVEEPQS